MMTMTVTQTQIRNRTRSQAEAQSRTDLTHKWMLPSDNYARYELRTASHWRFEMALEIRLNGCNKKPGGFEWRLTRTVSQNGLLQSWRKRKQGKAINAQIKT